MQQKNSADALSQLQAACHEAAASLRANSDGGSVILHHNDADGLSSGAILVRAVERFGLQPRRIVLEKPYPVVIKRIFSELSAKDLVIVADFGSGMLSTFEKANKNRARILFLDHHSVEQFQPGPEIKIVNPRLYGIAADFDCSAAVVCAFFALALSEFNLDLAAIGLVGATGDRQSFLAAGTINNALYNIALSGGRIAVESSGLISWSEEGVKLPVTEVADALDALGAFWYFKGGPDIGVKGLLEGFDPRYTESAKRARAEFEALFASLPPPQTSGRLAQFSLGTQFLALGVKSVGLACEQYLKSNPDLADSYIVGFQPLNTVIPGMGEILEPDWLKVSMRVGKGIREKILAGDAKPLSDLLPAATRAVGGFVDACHKLAAATTVPVAERDRFLLSLLQEIERTDDA